MFFFFYLHKKRLRKSKQKEVPNKYDVILTVHRR